MRDMEKVINGLEWILNDIEENGHGQLGYYADEIREAIALLKEQEKKRFFVDSDGKITPLPDVVRCKDCAYRGNEKKCIVAFVADKQDFPFFFYDNHGEWFCADGERRDG